MPFPAIVGNRVPLSLQARAAYDASRLLLNLGPVVVEPEDPEEPGDPDPVVGAIAAIVAARWSRGARAARQFSYTWGALAPQTAHARISWGGAALRRRSLAARWATPAVASTSVAALWGRGEANAVRSARGLWSSPEQRGNGVAASWREREALTARGLAASWRAPPTLAYGADARWMGSMPSVARRSLVPYTAPPLIRGAFRIPWGRGDGVAWFIRPPRPVEPPPVQSPFPDGLHVGLNLACRPYDDDPRRIPLNLGFSACWLARPQRRAYVVLNEISVVRLPDRLPIEVDSISIAGARDSAYWDATLTLANPLQLEAVSPTVAGPRAIEITINGYAWVVQVEAFDSSQVFGEEQVGIRGRSVTAQLADPYAAPRTRETTQQRTMVQLATAEVSGSPVTVDYGTVSWLVPAGAWYYDGLTPMSALARLAEASGAVVQSHPTEPVVQIRPRYPASPWAWVTTAPDAIVQDDIVTGTRLQLQSRPLYDAVIVAGERVGVAAKVKREGEAGQTFAPQQIDQLITHADGARERGRNVLSDRGGQALVEVDIPLFGGTLQAGQPGLVLPLQLVRRVTGAGVWHGLATAVRIEARRQDKAIDVQQTVTIERHYNDAD